MLGRAVERAILELGEARNIESIEGYRGERSWDKASFWERAEAMYLVDQPEGAGKMISKRQYHLIQLLIDYRNEVAHSEYRGIGRDEASRLIGQSLDLLDGLEGTRTKLDAMDGDEIPLVTNVPITS